MGNQEMVKEFHERFGVLVNNKPTIVSKETRDLRLHLMEEELEELEDAMFNENPAEIAKELADLLYVVYGTAVTYGINLEPIFKAVHKSNMSKGNPEVIKRDDGKILKGEGYVPPDVDSIIDKQQELSVEELVRELYYFTTIKEIVNTITHHNNVISLYLVPNADPYAMIEIEDIMFAYPYSFSRLTSDEYGRIALEYVRDE